MNDVAEFDERGPSNEVNPEFMHAEFSEFAFRRLHVINVDVSFAHAALKVRMDEALISVVPLVNISNGFLMSLSVCGDFTLANHVNGFCHGTLDGR